MRKRRQAALEKEESIIKQKRSLIVSCDFTTRKELEGVFTSVNHLTGIGAYKFGLGLILNNTLYDSVAFARQYTKKPIIVDLQKAGHDVPHIAELAMESCGNAMVDAVIIYPEHHIPTADAWIDAAQKHDLKVIFGSFLTAKEYTISEGGMIPDENVFSMYSHAVSRGISNLSGPGNKMWAMKEIKKIAEPLDNFVFYAIGFGEKYQGGKVESVKDIFDCFHVIVGRELTGAEDKEKVAVQYISKLH